MAVYSMYNFSRDPEENMQKCIEFLSELLGRKFDSLEDIEPALSDIYINGQSLAGTYPEAAANILLESLDADSLNVAMIKTENGFKALNSSQYVKRREGTAAPTQEERDKKARRDNEFISYINGLDASADNGAITVKNTDNAIDYLKNVTGMDDLDENNIKKALETIYIDGHSLSDRLGSAAPEAYANAVKQALSLNSGSHVTVMKKNDVFSQPKAVLPEFDDPTTPEAREKIVNTLGFVKSYRSAMCNESRLALLDTDKRTEKNVKLFFGSLFTEPDPGVAADKDLREESLIILDYTKEKLRSIDPERLSYDNFCSVVNQLFDNSLPGFVSSRTPENLCYSYMLTRINPMTGKNFTINEILLDDSDEMNEQKKLIGRDFCNIFQRINAPENEEQLNAEHYNNVIYPTLCKMTEAVLNVKCKIGDINEIDGVYSEQLADTYLHIVHDNLQQIQKCTDLAFVLNSTNPMTLVGTHITSHRTEYLASELYLSGDISNDDSKMHARHAAIAQELADSVDMTNTLNNVAAGAPSGTMLPIGTQILTDFINAGLVLDWDDIHDYIIGMPNGLSDSFNSEEGRRIFEEYREGLTQARNVPDDDIMRHAVETAYTDQANLDVTIDAIMHAYTGTPNVKLTRGGDPIQIAGSSGTSMQCEGACWSLLTYLTGCPVAENTDKQLFKAAFDKIYINSKSATEYFNITEDPDITKVKEIEKKLSEILMRTIDNNGPEFVCVKYGENHFKAAQVVVREGAAPIEVTENNRPKKQNYNDNERYERAVRAFEENLAKYESYNLKKQKLTPGNETSAAYAKLLSAAASDNELKESSELLNSRGVKAFGHYVDVRSARTFANNFDYGNLLCAFTGAGTAEEALAMADRVLINGKPVSASNSFISADDDQAKIYAMGQQIMRAFGENMTEDKWIKPIVILNEKGEPEPVKYFMSEPEKPKAVKKLTGFSWITASREERAAADSAYEKYEKDMENYKKEMAYKDKIDKRILECNTEADMMRVSIIKRGVSAAPAVRTTSINNLATGRTAADTRTLTQPTVSRSGMDGPNMNNNM